ncbi:Rap1 Myb domain-containing protein [Microdochium nivale]|nr:Rap1 Myb domain-containing protein [Microdochium nivale]
MPITYHNVRPTTDAGAGTLFKDMSFWFAQRIPDRSNLMGALKANGGSIKALDKLADVKIADLARDPAPGSVSYKWIQDCLEQSTLLPKEDYTCAGGTSVPRPAAAGPTRKGTRVPFTTEEDRFLTGWVMKHEAEGFAAAGNVIFKRLEAVNPRHTYQSWRDHWVKQLSKRPQIALSQEELDAIDIHNESQDLRAATTGPAPSQPAQRSPSANRSTYSAATQLDPVRAKYTPAEDTALLELYFEVTSRGSDNKQQDLYNKLADTYTHHTSQSWRDRLIKTIEAKVKDKLKTTLEDLGEENIPHLVRWLHAQRQDAQSFWEVVDSGSAVQNDAETPAKSTAESEVQTRAGARERKHSTISASEQVQTRPPLVVVEKPVWSSTPQPSSPAAEKVPSPVPSHTTPTVYVQSPELPVRSRMSALAPEGELSGEDKAQVEFYTDYTVFIETTEQQPMHFPSVAGHSFQLWDLWREAMAQQLHPDERDWELVAENLGIDWNEHPDAPEQVRLFYLQHLGLFEEAMQNFEHSDGEVPSDTISEDPMPSSPPLVRQVKRPAEVESVGRIDSLTPHKRRRRERDIEVPSTPDDRTETAHLRQPAKNLRSQNGHDHGVDEIMAPQASNAEPITQDFPYETAKETQYYDAMEHGDEDEDDDDMTPSRQLILESDSAQPPEIKTSPPHLIVASAAVTNKGTLTPRRAPRTPFLDEDDDASDLEQTPLTKFRHPQANKVAPVAKRRALPKSFTAERTLGQPQQRQAQVESPTPPRPTPATDMASGISTAGPTAATANAKLQTQQQQQQQQNQQPLNAEDVIADFVLQGFTRNTVIRAMHATTWDSGLGLEVMRQIQMGNGLPERARYVWTPKDDEYLRLIMAADAAAATAEAGARDGSTTMMTEKEKKRLARARRAIEIKHTLTSSGPGVVVEDPLVLIERRKKFLLDERSAWRTAR